MVYSALRFAVGTPDGPRSSTWRVWVGDDGSAFVSTRTLGGNLRVSLHASGRWRIAFADPSTPPRIGGPAGHRAFDTFRPGPEIKPGVRHGVMVVIPWLAVGLPPGATPDARGIYWLPPPAEGQVTCVPVFLTAPDTVVDGAVASRTGRRGSGVALKYATRAARPEEVAQWTGLDAPLTASEGDETAGTAADADTADIKEGFVVGTMPDGTRWLLDLRIPRPNRTA